MTPAIPDPEDVATHLWGLASAREALAGSVLMTRPAAPGLTLASYLYAVRPAGPGALDADLDLALDRGVRRVVLESSTPPWVEAALRLRGWAVEDELRLELPRGTQLSGSPPSIEVRPASHVDQDWQVRAGMLRADHLEEDARHGVPARPTPATEAIVEHRRAIAEFAPYLCAMHDGEVAGFLCTWLSPARVGVIEDVYVRPPHRGRGIATALLHAAVAELRASGAGRIAIAAEIGDTPARLYSHLGFQPRRVVRSCVWSTDV
ncbi:GNAT family N-acetyltransferase [Pseudactinotalea sp.]|uniref:GNAT family N-acetyltransferase n=1 Tax=Pseudactinotalea sp. TaxID=1926260 RepID=UPI003B3B642B